jgi:ethanolamine utilization cobalamin adenosyltransferase
MMVTACSCVSPCREVKAGDTNTDLALRKKVLPLGTYPKISLKQAQELSHEAKSFLREKGINIVEHARQALIAAEQEQLRRAEQLDVEQAEPMFKQLVDEYVDSLEGFSSQYDVKCALYKDAVAKWHS